MNPKPKYDPNAKALYKVGHIPQNAKRTMIVTEVRRPEPLACLHLKEGETVELTNEEVRVLLHGDNGPVIPRDLLTKVEAAPAAPAKAAAAEPAAPAAEAKPKPGK